MPPDWIALEDLHDKLLKKGRHLLLVGRTRSR